jgi:hypothetical protein
MKTLGGRTCPARARIPNRTTAGSAPSTAASSGFRTLRGHLAVVFEVPGQVDGAHASPTELTQTLAAVGEDLLAVARGTRGWANIGAGKGTGQTAGAPRSRWRRWGGVGAPLSG